MDEPIYKLSPQEAYEALPNHLRRIIRDGVTDVAPEGKFEEAWVSIGSIAQGVEKHIAYLTQELEAARERGDRLSLLNRVLRHQADVSLHPYSCGLDSSHMPLMPEFRDGALVLVCRGSALDQAVGRACEYMQAYSPDPLGGAE